MVSNTSNLNVFLILISVRGIISGKMKQKNQEKVTQLEKLKKKIQKTSKLKEQYYFQLHLCQLFQKTQYLRMSLHL